MSIKVTYQNTKEGKQVTIVAGNATYKYKGVAEIPANVQEQLRFFNFWDDIVEKLPVTVHFNNVKKLQEAVVEAARGNIEPAAALVGGPAIPSIQDFTIRIVGDCEVSGLSSMAEEATRRGQTAASRAVRQSCGRAIGNSEELLQAVGADAMSDADMIARAPKHGQYWEQQDRDRLLGWFKQARRENLVLNVVKAGQLLGRTPYACLCQLIQHKVLSESTVYDLVSVMHEALGNVRRAAQFAKRKKALENQARQDLDQILDETLCDQYQSR